jgi:antitoxin component of MazEF toxin-antitoxin module
MDKIKKLRKIGGSVYLLISHATAQEAGVSNGSCVGFFLDSQHELLIVKQSSVQNARAAGIRAKLVCKRGGSLHVLIPADYLAAMHAGDKTAVTVCVDSKQRIVVTALPDDWEVRLQAITRGS